MNDEQTMANQLVALARSGSLSRQMVPDLLRIAREERGRASSVAVYLLGTLRAEAAEAVPFLVDLLHAHRHDAFGRTVARALGAIGPAAREAVPKLRLARRSDNKWVRKAARDALGRIEFQHSDSTDSQRWPTSE
ncbi:MAG: HEAT repeat domain-containing protein [Pirellulales bacterium]